MLPVIIRSMAQMSLLPLTHISPHSPHNAVPFRYLKIRSRSRNSCVFWGRFLFPLLSNHTPQREAAEGFSHWSQSDSLKRPHSSQGKPSGNTPWWSHLGFRLCWNLTHPGQDSVCRSSHGKIRGHSASGCQLMSSAIWLGAVNGFNYLFFLPTNLLICCHFSQNTVILGFLIFFSYDLSFKKKLSTTFQGLATQ